MIETLPEFLVHWAERTPDAVFVAEPDRGRSFTYGQIAARVPGHRGQTLTCQQFPGCGPICLEVKV